MILNNDLRKRLSKYLSTNEKLIYYFDFDEKQKEYKVVFHQGHETLVKYISLNRIFTLKEIRCIKLKKLIKNIRKL